MKNLINIAGIVTGIAIGFFGKDYISVLTNNPRPATEITVRQARDFIDDLYDKPDRIKETIMPSYVFDLKEINDNGAKLGIDKDKMQLRIFPALNEKDSLTFVIGIEDNIKLYITKLGLFEYISPCPTHCPKENDIFHKDEWIAKYKEKLNRDLKF